MFLPAILILACESSSLAFHMNYSAFKLDKQGEDIQPWCIPFPVWNQCIISPVLIVASCPAYRFLMRQVRWSGIPIFFRIFHSLLWSTQSKAFSIVNEAGVDVFLELSCFFDDPVDIGNLISGSSAFSKSSFYVWKLLVHILLKTSLKDFEHYLASMWNESNCMIAWTFFNIALLWDWNENWLFPGLWPLLSFPNVLAYWVQHFNSIIF